MPRTYRITVEDKRRGVDLVPLHRALLAMDGVKDMSLLSYNNGVALVALEMVNDIDADAPFTRRDPRDVTARRRRDAQRTDARREAGGGVMRWLKSKKAAEAIDEGESTFMEDLAESRPEGREGRLFDLVILTLFLHSAGSISEMVGAFVEKAPSVTDAVFVYPLVLEKKRDVLSATRARGHRRAAPRARDGRLPGGPHGA